MSDLFSRRHRLWRLMSNEDKSADLHAVSDPLARASSASLSSPVQFFRAGDGRTAAGIWTVTDTATGQRVGTYRAAFRQEGGRWKFESVEVGGANDSLALTPYCHGLGDIDAYLSGPRETD